MTNQELKFLKQTLDGLRKMDLERRHDFIVALIAWHLASCPEKIMKELLGHMSERALALLNAAKERKGDAPPDLRH